MLPILAHEDRFPRQPHLAANHGLQLPPAQAIASAAPLRAFINDGRWLVQCNLPHPERGAVCNSAELAHRGDHRFFCADCAHRAIGGGWRMVVWPDDAEEIEHVLSARPSRGVQNWDFMMTVADLRTANALHGIHTA